MWPRDRDTHAHRHTDHVRCVAFAPDGKTLASGSYDHTVKLWDVATGTEIPHAHRGQRDERGLCARWQDLGSGSWYGVRLWDVATGIQIRALKGHGLYVQSVAFAPDGKTLASGSSDTLKLWDVARGQRSDARRRRHRGESLGLRARWQDLGLWG